MQGRKKYTPPPWRPPFFLFPGLRLYGVYPSFRTYGVYPFPLFSQENGVHHSFFCSVTSGSGDRPRKEGSRGGGVYSFFPCNVGHDAGIIASAMPPCGEPRHCGSSGALQTVGQEKPININIFGRTVSGTNRNRPWDKWDPSP